MNSTIAIPLMYCLTLLGQSDPQGTADVSSGKETSSKEQLEFLIEANASALALIREVDLVVDVNLRHLMGPQATSEPSPSEVWRLSRQGTQERAQTHTLRASDDGTLHSADFRDIFSDGSIQRMLTGWNSETPPEITPLEQKGVKGVIQPRQPGLLTRDPEYFLLMNFPTIHGDARLSLPELVAQAPKVELIGRSTDNGHNLWQLRVFDPGKDGVADGSYQDLFLDPEANFMARKRVVHYTQAPHTQSDGSAIQVPADVVTEVMKFESKGDGVFFPVEFHHWASKEVIGGKYVENHGQVSSLTVNAPLPADAFRFAFPESLQVRHFPPVDGKVKVELWGADNKPAAEITGGYEQLRGLAGLPPVEMPKAAETGNSRIWWLVAVNAAIVCVAVTLWFKKWKRR